MPLEETVETSIPGERVDLVLSGHCVSRESDPALN